nr:MAG TPA: hypothetical protein [Caudoviricetes sp.]
MQCNTNFTLVFHGQSLLLISICLYYQIITAIFQPRYIITNYDIGTDIGG